MGFKPYFCPTFWEFQPHEVKKDNFGFVRLGEGDEPPK